MSEIEWHFDYTFRIAVETHDGVTVLRFIGDLDALTAKHLQARGPLPPPPIPAMVLDLSELEYIDISGVREIRRIEDLAVSSGGSSEIRGTSADVQDALDLIPRTLPSAP